MDCPTIRNLKLDHDDYRLIEDLRRRIKLGGILQKFMPIGVLTSIFLGNNSAGAVYNVGTQDFKTFAEATMQVDKITRGVIEKEAAWQALKPGKTRKQIQFWKAINEGCGL